MSRRTTQQQQQRQQQPRSRSTVTVKDNAPVRSTSTPVRRQADVEKEGAVNLAAKKQTYRKAKFDALKQLIFELRRVAGTCKQIDPFDSEQDWTEFANKWARYCVDNEGDQKETKVNMITKLLLEMKAPGAEHIVFKGWVRAQKKAMRTEDEIDEESSESEGPEEPDRTTEVKFAEKDSLVEDGASDSEEDDDSGSISEDDDEDDEEEDLETEEAEDRTASFPSVINVNVPATHSSSTEEEKACWGKYEQLPGRSANGLPIWKHESTERWLFFGSDGHWYIGGDAENKSNFSQNTGYIRHATDEKSMPPNMLKGPWSRGKLWETDPEISVSANPTTGDGASSKGSVGNSVSSFVREVSMDAATEPLLPLSGTGTHSISPLTLSGKGVIAEQSTKGATSGQGAQEATTVDSASPPPAAASGQGSQEAAKIDSTSPSPAANPASQVQEKSEPLPGNTAPQGSADKNTLEAAKASQVAEQSKPQEANVVPDAPVNTVNAAPKKKGIGLGLFGFGLGSKSKKPAESATSGAAAGGSASPAGGVPSTTATPPTTTASASASPPDASSKTNTASASTTPPPADVSSKASSKSFFGGSKFGKK